MTCFKFSFRNVRRGHNIAYIGRYPRFCSDGEFHSQEMSTSEWPTNLRFACQWASALVTLQPMRAAIRRTGPPAQQATSRRLLLTTRWSHLINLSCSSAVRQLFWPMCSPKASRRISYTIRFGNSRSWRRVGRWSSASGGRSCASHVSATFRAYTLSEVPNLSFLKGYRGSCSSRWCRKCTVRSSRTAIESHSTKEDQPSRKPA